MKEPGLTFEDTIRDSSSGNSYYGDSDLWDHTYSKTEWPPGAVCVKEDTELPKDPDCPKGASECVDKHAGWSNTQVKQEPLCGVSEAAILAGLYTDHAVKEELVLGPEGVQHLSLLNALCSSNWPVTLKQEPPDSPETVSLRESVVHDAMLTNTQTYHEVTSSVEEASEDQFDRNNTVVEETLVWDACSEQFNLKSHILSHVTVTVDIVKSESGFDDDGENASDQASATQPRSVQPKLRECVVRLERITHHDILLLQTTGRRSPVGYDARDSTHNRHTETYGCDTCGKIYQRKRKLIRHIQLHMRRRNPKKSNNIYKSERTCGMCSKSCECKCKPYMCDTCGKRFKQACHLTRHNRIHTGDLYSCDICNKNFTRLDNLRDHKRIHAGQGKAIRGRRAKLYPCEICKKLFSQLRSLKAHRRIHTGEKPFTCDICKMRFARLDTVNRHKRTHTGQMSYSCQICNREFTRLSNFKEHNRMHTGQKPYSCDVCKRRFTRLSTLKLHGQNFHMPDKA